jgi:hypothetical protein
MALDDRTMKNFTTRQEIEDGRNQARDGDVWMENGQLAWKGRPPGWALQMDQAIRDKQEAVSNWAAEKALRFRAEADKLEMQQAQGWKKLCPKCEERHDLLLRYRAALAEIAELDDVRADEASSIASRALDDEEGR